MLLESGPVQVLFRRIQTIQVLRLQEQIRTKRWHLILALQGRPASGSLRAIHVAKQTKLTSIS